MNKKQILAIATTVILTGCNATSFQATTQSHSQSHQQISEIVVEQIYKGSKSWDGSKLPAYPEGTPELQLLKVTVPPGAKVDWHKHQVVNIGYVLNGTIDVFAENGLKTTVSAGQAINELVEQWHYGVNNSDEFVHLIVFYAGIEGTDVTIKKNDD